MRLEGIDFYLFSFYIFLMMALGLYLSLSRKNKTSSDYFMAGRNLPWWAIGGSLIASNISAEQFIGMSGSGFKLGLAIASYEFMAAITLILIAWLIIPIFLKEKISTLPEFIEKRFGKEVRTGLALFWFVLFVFLNVTTVLYLGALTMQATLGWSIWAAVALLVVYSATFSVLGGLKTVVFTDMVQVVVLFAGGLLTTVLALHAMAPEGQGWWAGLEALYQTSSDHFNMVLFKGEKMYVDDSGQTVDAWTQLPGWGVLFGGMWIANLYYWGTNQYIIQRALGAKSLSEARKGIGMAAVMKLFLPLIVVIPGMVAYAMQADVTKGDQVYAWVLNEFVPVGLKGICLAAVIAAVGSSVSSMVNSASTLFTLDLYKPYINRSASETHYVGVGKIVALLSLLVAALIAPALQTLDQAFQYIQNITGHFSPGILVIFLFGMFWKRSTKRAAIAVILLSLPISMGLALGFTDAQLPFMHRMSVSFFILSLLMIGVSLLEQRDAHQAIAYHPLKEEKPSLSFRLMALFILVALTLLYTLLF